MARNPRNQVEETQQEETGEEETQVSEVKAETSVEEKALAAAKAGEEFTQTVKAKLVVIRDFAVNMKGQAREFGENQVLTQADVDFLGEMVDGRIQNGFIKVQIS